jgi:OmcA/MtrC family decaheme c-type cytochrome
VTELTIDITGVTISSPPVVEFTAVEENGIPVTGLKAGSGGNLRFTIAKLTPGMNGSPSAWQSYVNNSSSQATYDRDGTLEDLGNGQFRYTFETDITDPAETGGISYESTLTHRVAIQLDGFPAHNPTYDFIPAGGAVTFMREIVKTETCNTCHNKLAMHGGGRIKMQYCVTCHNPGTIDPDSGNTVDFKVMIHKIHRGEDLPSVISGDAYQIIGYGGSVHDYSTVVFPQDIRNCTKCHDGSDPETPQGDAWQVPSIMACGSCHDDVDFSDGTNHDGGVQTDATCMTCHDGVFAMTTAEAHEIPEQIAREAFQFNIEDVSGGATPTIQISITDPTFVPPGPGPGTPPRYDITDDEFTGPGARLALVIGWGITDDPIIDFNNTGGTTNNGFPIFKDTAAQPISIDPVAYCGAAPPDAEWTCTPDSPENGIYTLTKASPLPASATGTGRVGFEGHVAADFDGDSTFDDEVAVKSVVHDFVITGTLTPRREVVDIAKCDNCHEFLSLHGGNRNDEPALCVICHNPNATDIGRRPLSTDTPVLPTTDGKVEEAIDFKTLIHGIHAGAQTNYDGTEAHGFREEGLVIWGFPGAPCDAFGGALGSCEHDFSHVRFPGILQDCEACHLSGTYELDGVWEYPTSNGILSTTISTLDVTDPADDLNISPTAAVCSSCHDSLLARSHMIVPGSALVGETQANIDIAAGITPETCALCHGPGQSYDVEVVHAGR